MATFASKVAVAAAVLFVVARADDGADQADKMKGIGMPILFIVTLGVAAFLTRTHLLSAFQASRGDINLASAFFSSVISAAMSIFLYFSPAYNYGLVSTVLAYFIACVCNGAGVQAYAKPIAGVTAGWFCILVGIPELLSAGIINKVSKTTCQNFYNTYKDTMCKDGWVVFVEILACVQIGFTLLSLLTLVNLALNTPEQGTYSPVKSGERGEYSPPSASAPPAQQAAAGSEYHKMP